MKDLFKNKKVLLLVAVAIVFGIALGWIFRSAGSSETHQDHLSHQAEEGEEWTCSMHPQIRQSEPGQCPICGMDLILASKASGNGNTSDFVYQMTPQAAALAQVHTTRVQGISSDGELFLTGKVQSDERQVASVTAKFPARIEKLFVNFTGQEVKRGERLATVYSPELVTAQKELLEALSTKSAFPELYDAAREKLRQWKLSESQIDQIVKSGKVQDRFNILADQGGVVIQRNVSEGDYLDLGMVLFDVVDLSKVWVLLDVYESDLEFVRVGDEVRFKAAGISGTEFTGKVSFIDRVINASTRALKVRVEVVNPNGMLRPEMFVTATLNTKVQKENYSVAIPRTALLWSGKRSVVYVKVPDAELPSFEMREVTIGPRMGDMWFVESGLEPGEEIVSNGVFAIDAAAQLSGNYSMMVRPDSRKVSVPEEFKEQMTVLSDAYIQVKNALVEEDTAELPKRVEQMLTAVDEAQDVALEEKALEQWHHVRTGIRDIGSSMRTHTDLEKHRKEFSELSAYMKEVLEVFGLEKEIMYQNYCPMAFDNKGAFWISETKEIRNPYFGSAMLSCGEITKEYRNK